MRHGSKGKFVQNSYVGDFGDYVKLALLRSVSAVQTLGVSWWLFENQKAASKRYKIPKDGERFTNYVDQPDKWRHLDPLLFEYLLDVVKRKRINPASISIADLMSEQLFPNVKFFSELIYSPQIHYKQRPAFRAQWFSRMRDSLRDCETIFVDPDNGLEPAAYRQTSYKSGKAVEYKELRELSRDKTVIVYHHQTRYRGGHIDELHAKAKLLRQHTNKHIDAIRARNFNPRLFFIVNGSDVVRQNAKGFCDVWDSHCTWHSNVGL